MPEDQNFYLSSEDPRTNDEVIAAALAINLNAETEEDWTYTRTVGVFYYRVSHTALAQAQQLCVNESARVRLTGAHILKSLIEGVANGPSQRQRESPSLPYNSFLSAEDTKPFLVAVKNTLFAILETEPDEDVLQAITAALGFLYDAPYCKEETLKAILHLSTHPSENIRYHAAGALWHVHDEEAVPALLRLMRDTDEDVRDWATFGLGSQNVTDTPEIRDALFDALTDDNPDVQGEALCGLARRGDLRAVDALLALPVPLDAEDDGTYQSEALISAGRAIADPRLLPLLEHFASSLTQAGKTPWHDLLEALEACRTGKPAVDDE